MDLANECPVDGLSERLLTRQEITIRWGCGLSSVKRLEKRGVLQPIVLGPKLLRYRLSDIVRVEHKFSENRNKE